MFCMEFMKTPYLVTMGSGNNSNWFIFTFANTKLCTYKLHVWCYIKKGSTVVGNRAVHQCCTGSLSLLIQSSVQAHRPCSSSVQSSPHHWWVDDLCLGFCGCGACQPPLNQLLLHRSSGPVKFFYMLWWAKSTSCSRWWIILLLIFVTKQLVAMTLKHFGMGVLVSKYSFLSFRVFVFSVSVFFFVAAL